MPTCIFKSWFGYKRGFRCSSEPVHMVLLVVREGTETGRERERDPTMKSIAVLLRHRPIIENENKDVCSGFTFRSHKSIVPLNWVMDSVTQPSPFPSLSSACPSILIKVSITLSCPSRGKRQSGVSYVQYIIIKMHTHTHTHTHCYMPDVWIYLCVKSLQSGRLHLTCHVSCVKKNKMKYLLVNEENNNINNN